MRALPEDTIIRRLAPGDLDAVVALDAASVGRARRAYFERRLQAALAAPSQHVQFAIDRGGALAGYLLARRVVGEFGRDEPALRIEVLGVHAAHRGHGLARALLEEASHWAASRGVSTLRTQATWRDHSLLRFFDHAGFELSRNPVIDCVVSHAARALDVHEPAEPPVTREIDYSSAATDDERTQDRIGVRLLTPADTADIVRVDRHLTGRDRAVYLNAAVQEALENTAVRVSLVARLDGVFAGYVMARTDYGDFGRAEPVAVLDTLGVDPAFGRRGVGRALASQLFLNLEALRVERAETVATRDNFGLLAFLYRVGFGTSPTLALERTTPR